MNTWVLILADGPQSYDWTEQEPKQLAPIAGEPLILRTLRQLEERGYDNEVVVVTHNEAIEAVVPRYVEPEHCRWWPETLLSTRDLWAERTVVLNADVIFSPAVLNAILAEEAPIAFYGTPIEAFAVVFKEQEHERVVEALEAAIEDSENGGRGLIWGFYRAICGFPLRRHIHNRDIYRMRPENDYTHDIDKVKGYRKFLDENRWARNA